MPNSNENLEAILNGSKTISDNLLVLSKEIYEEILKYPNNAFLKSIINQIVGTRIDLANLNVGIVQMVSPSDENYLKEAKNNLEEARATRDYVQQEVASVEEKEREEWIR